MKLILIFILIRLTIDVLTKQKYDTLNCGIWGYYGQDTKGYNPAIFNMLGFDNDSRGGDACGVTIGEKYFHDNDTLKSYKKLSKEIPFVRLPKGTQSVFGHARKASFIHGGNNEFKSLEYTQPCVDLDENNKPLYYFLHNGTIYNHESLAEEHNIDISNFKYYNEVSNEDTNHKKNDSLILMELFKQNKFEVLLKYRGGASFAFYDVKKDLLYLYSGESLDSDYTKRTSRERPLFVLQEKSHIWFSSIITVLEAAASKQGKVFALPTNKLFIYHKGKQINVLEYDRTGTYQTKETIPYKAETHHNNSHRRGSYGYPAYDDDYYENMYETSSSRTPSTYNHSHNRNQSSRASESNKSFLHVDNITFANSMLGNENFSKSEHVMGIIFARGRYWFKGELASGEMHIAEFGVVYDAPRQMGAITSKPYYFYQGIMLEDQESFHTVQRQFSSDRILQSKMSMALLAEDTICPVHSIGVKESTVKYNAITNEVELYTGTFEPLFSNHKYCFVDGELTSIIVMNNFNYPTHTKVRVPYVSKEIVTSIPVKNGAKFCIHCETAPVQSLRIYCDQCSNELFGDDDDKNDESSIDDLDKAIVEEIDKEVEIALNSVNDCKDKVAIYSDTTKGKNCYKLFEKIEDLILGT